MALQLIYTSAEQLLDSSQPGYGVVARSEVMPREMRRKLVELSRYRSVSGSSSAAVQCCYSTLAHANAEYHVLTVSQPAGADYSGRLCYISHHLVLLPEEVTALQRNKHRPTPAGIILALGERGLWCSRWQGPPKYISGEPALHTEDIPEAGNQSTWKRLTGHKSNARAFNTPPFDRDCLMIVPSCTPVADILKLWHESDWLSLHCGWGKTFTTHADDSDNFRLTQRWSCEDSSPLIRKAMRTGHPVLLISSDLEIGELSNDSQTVTSVIPPAGVIAPEDSQQFQRTLAARQAARMIPPYQYSEEPDEEIFDLSGIRKKRSRRLIARAVASVLLLAGGLTCGTVYYFYHHQGAARIGDNAAYRSLRTIISRPYDASIVAQELEKTAALAKAAREPENPRNRAILRVIELLQQASESEKHASNLRRLCNLAKQWKLNKVRLCLLYMHEATHNRPAEEWVKTFSRDELREWERLIADEPELRAGLNEPELLAYFDRVMDSRSDKSAPEKISSDHKDHDTYIPLTINDELPEELLRILRSVPLTIEQGTCRLFRMPWDTAANKAEEIKLNPARLICMIVRSAADDYYHLRFISPGDKSGMAHADIDICVSQNKLVSVSCGGAPVALSFPVADSHIILIPKLAIPLRGLLAPVLPDIGSDAFTLTRRDLEVIPPTASHMSVSLTLANKPGMPWSMTTVNGAPRQFSFRLPLLADSNRISALEINAVDKGAVRWGGVSGNGTDGDFSVFTCKLTPESDISKILQDTFHKLANSGCAGEVSQADPMFSLAMVYTTLLLMDKQDITPDEWNSAAARYCTLFNNKAFSELMQRVAPEAQGVLLTHDTASSRSAAGKTEQRRVLSLLQKKENRSKLINCILAFFSNQLRDTYRKMQQQADRDMNMRLLLRKISGEHNRLHWHFELQPEGDNQRN